MTVDPASVPTTRLVDALREWMPQQRWFAAKGLALNSLTVLSRQRFAATPEVGAENVLVEAAFDSSPPQTYQVPLGYRPALPASLRPWVLAEPDESAPRGLFVFDGLRDPEVLDAYARQFVTGGMPGTDVRRLSGWTLEPGLRSRVLDAEQSNTSAVLGERSMLKVFRRLTSGTNPDVELPVALAERRCSSIAPVHAWSVAEVDGLEATLAMVQEFAANSADGWSIALGSVRDLLLEGDLRADEVGTDFAGEAARMGAAVADVHAHLAEIPGAGVLGGDEVAAGMIARFEAAAAEVGALAETARPVRARFEAVASLREVRVQRMHGDLHLGQVLRTPDRWLLIDFEGEPAKSLEERRRPDSPLRDVAGMLRSFDYAAHHSVREGESVGVASQREFRAREWVERNCGAFCDGYAAAAGFDPRDAGMLLGAYELDKAVYEVVYEARNRPTWLGLPLAAIARLTSA